MRCPDCFSNRTTVIGDNLLCLNCGRQDYLNKLRLSLKQCFKFLNTPSLSLKYKIMFLARQCHQVIYSVIILNTIKVMYNPALGQIFPVCFFPNKNVLWNIYPMYVSRMPWTINPNISHLTFCFASLPIWVLRTPPVVSKTSNMIISDCSDSSCTRHAILGIFTNWFTANCTWMLQSIIRQFIYLFSSFFSNHTYIITYINLRCDYANV